MRIRTHITPFVANDPYNKKDSAKKLSKPKNKADIIRQKMSVMRSAFNFEAGQILHSTFFVANDPYNKKRSAKKLSKPKNKVDIIKDRKCR